MENFEYNEKFINENPFFNKVMIDDPTIDYLEKDLID